MLHRDQEVKATRASGKHPLSSSHRWGNWGKGESGSHLENLSEICLRAKDGGSRVPQAPGCLSSLVHCDTCHQLSSKGTEKRKLIKHKPFTGMTELTVQKGLNNIPSPNRKSPLTSKTNLRHIALPLTHRARAGSVKTSPIACSWQKSERVGMLSKSPPKNLSLVLSGKIEYSGGGAHRWSRSSLQPSGAEQSMAGTLIAQLGDKSSLGCRGELPRKYLNPRASSLA